MLRSDCEGTLGLNTVFIYGPYIHMPSGTAMISCKMIHTKKLHKEMYFFFRSVFYFFKLQQVAREVTS